jgi:hypothetical protein
MDHLQGNDRDQLTLFPEALDDYISQENPVRFLNAYVDSLDLGQLGFRHAVLQETGRPHTILETCSSSISTAISTVCGPAGSWNAKPTEMRK